MLSRVAQSVFWMNRYVERAENYSRFLEVNQAMTLDLQGDLAAQWTPLVDTTGDSSLFQQLYDTAEQASVIEFLTFNRQNPNSIISCINQARENARQIRDNISLEMWQSINHLYLWLKDKPDLTSIGINAYADFLSEIRRQCASFYGLQDATIMHDEVWYFSLAGRLLERADKTTRILDIKYYILLPNVDYIGSPLDLLQWIALLKSAGAHEMYNRQYREITPYGIAEFLILNTSFPRAIHYCVKYLDSLLKKISGAPADGWSNEAEKKTGRYYGELNFCSIEDILRHGLHEYIDLQQIRLNEIGQAIHECYFPE
ncbi:MAG: alpha-E domain-containing protein [Leptospiraceae bacterium]|nr:alpha-E domain-containing protein [Leptospiraceae bacterium]